MTTNVAPTDPILSPAFAKINSLSAVEFRDSGILVDEEIIIEAHQISAASIRDNIAAFLLGPFHSHVKYVRLLILKFGAEPITVCLPPSYHTVATDSLGKTYLISSRAISLYNNPPQVIFSAPITDVAECSITFIATKRGIFHLDVNKQQFVKWAHNGSDEILSIDSMSSDSREYIAYISRSSSKKTALSIYELGGQSRLIYYKPLIADKLFFRDGDLFTETVGADIIKHSF